MSNACNGRNRCAQQLYRPFLWSFFADPYPFHEQLREAGPVVRLEKYGIYGMARHAQVQAALNDWKTFISGAGAGIQDLRKTKAWRPRSIVLEVDPPLHDETRAVMGRVLSGPAIKKLREAFEIEAERLVEELVSRGTFDAVNDLAVVYPLKVMGDAVGVPAVGRKCLLPFSNMLFNSFGPENETFRQSIIEFRTRCQKTLRSVRTRIAGTGRLRRADLPGGGRRPDQQGARACARAFHPLSGFDTTVSGLGNAIYAFATNPDQWLLLRESPALQRSAFDEIIRWEAPVQTFFRTTSQEVLIEGVHLKPDQKVLLFLGSANRDPRRWDNPDRLDLRRKTVGHVAFGSGIHVCVGMMIARLEAELLFAAFAKRVAGFEIVGEPTRRHNNTLRTFANLPVRVVH